MWPFTRTREPSDRQLRGLEESFRRRFPDGGLSWSDFRPHFNGFMINAWSTLPPQANAITTRANAIELLKQIAEWLRANVHSFNAEDRIQVIVGFDESVKPAGRQIFKCWVPAARLSDLHELDFSAAGGAFRELEAWSVGVAWSSP